MAHQSGCKEEISNFLEEITRMAYKQGYEGQTQKFFDVKKEWKEICGSEPDQTIAVMHDLIIQIQLGYYSQGQKDALINKNSAVITSDLMRN